MSKEILADIQTEAFKLAKKLDGTRPSEDFGLWLIEDCLLHIAKLAKTKRKK